MNRDNEAGAHGQARDEFLRDLPDPADDWRPEPSFDPSDADLAVAGHEEQIELMRRWFLARYCDPAEETPYESREGGYIWVRGGPYDPREQLGARFEGVADRDAIEELASELYSIVGAEWAPIGDMVDDYYQRFALELESEDPDDPLSKLRLRLRQTLSVLDLQGDQEAMAQLPRMVFGSVISALEAYLWETVAYWAKTSRMVLKGIVSNMPDLKDEPLKLSQIFEQHDAIETRVKLYLQNLVWHRWDRVAQLFRFGLGVKPPSFRPFEEALIKRHDIVHRSGHDKEGNPVTVSAQDARELARAVEVFAEQLYSLIMERVTAQAFVDDW